MTGGPDSPGASHPLAGLAAGTGAVLGLLALWTAVAWLVQRPQVLPGPWAVMAELARLSATGDLWRHMGATLARVVASFALAMTVGTGMGVALGRRAGLDRWAGPMVLIALNLPALVVIVLCYIWIGLNETAAIAAVAINKVPMVTVMIRDGTRALSPALDDMARAFALPARDRWRHVVMPQLAPHLASAARTGMALVWKIVLVVEFLGRSNGVGFQLHLSFQLFDVAAVLAWALAFVALMLAIDGLVLRPCERRAFAWRHDAA